MPDYAAFSTTAKLLALSRYGQVNPRLLDFLLRKFGRIDAILSADRSALSQIEGLSAAGIGRILKARDRLEEASIYIEGLAKRDISVTNRFDDGYPRRLLELNDPPPLLFCRGRLPDSDRKTVTLAGADEATEDGIEMTSRLAKLFCGAGVQVIAPLTGGIAAAAHLAARVAGVASYAVVDSGFDVLADTEEMALAIDIATAGGLVSEYSPNAPLAKDALPQSNRLMVGLAHAVVFTELYEDSVRAHDMLEFCNQNGKLSFFFVNPEAEMLADEKSLQRAVNNGSIVISGYNSVPDIIRSLV